MVRMDIVYSISVSIFTGRPDEATEPPETSEKLGAGAVSQKKTNSRDDYQQAELTLPFPGHYYKSESFCITVDWEFHTSKYFLTHKSSTIQCHKKIFNVCNYSPWKDITTVNIAVYMPHGP